MGVPRGLFHFYKQAAGPPGPLHKAKFPPEIIPRDINGRKIFHFKDNDNLRIESKNAKNCWTVTIF